MASETFPLLPAPYYDEPSSDYDEPLSPASSKPATRASAIVEHLRKWRVIYLCLLFAFVVDFTEFARMAVSLRMIENRICRAHYSKSNPELIGPGGEVSERYCKIGAIQSRLAKVQGLAGMLDILPSITGLVLAQSWFYLVMSEYSVFPFWAMYTPSLLLIIGGGGFVLQATMLAILADVVPAAIRTRIFFLVNVVILVSELFAPATGSSLMAKYGANTAYLIGIPPYILVFIILLCIPETAKFKNTTDSAEDITTDGYSEPLKDHSKLRQRLDALLDHVQTAVIPMLTRRTIMLGLIATVVASFAVPIFAILIQYMSTRFHWKLEQSAYLLSFQAGVNIFMLCIVLPLVSGYLTKRYNDPERSNLVLSKGSVIFLILGPLGLGLSPHVAGIFISIIIYTFGSGLAGALRSFLTSLVAPNEVALLYTLIALSTSVGSLIGVPLLALTFSTGINIGGFALGFPFFFAAGMYAVSGISIWSMRLPPKVEELSDESAA